MLARIPIRFASPSVPRAFARFACADHARVRGGTGLGLAKSPT